MTSHHIVRGISVALFAGMFLWLLPLRSILPLEGDAVAYNSGAINMILNGMYSIDGVRPFFDREIGMSAFLAPIYLLFGIENYAAVFTVQALLYFASVFLFLREMRRLVSMRVATIAFALFLTFPASFHIIFSLNRELLTFVVTILFVTCMLAYIRNPRWWLCALGGLFMGYAILTYAPLLLLPFFLLPVFVWWKIRMSHFLLFFLCIAAVMAPWGIRNFTSKGSLCLTGCTRSALTWYVRGEQAEQVKGIEPIMCLWAEYVSRDWTNRSPACSFNKVWHEKWPGGFTGLDSDVAVGREGQRKILQNFPSYLWFSAVDVIELHLPYVNGWGRAYNMLAAVGTAILYMGMIFSLPGSLRRKEYAIFWFIMAYITAIFVLTDATPRYLMPVIFCYVFFAGVGYDRALSRIKWPR